MYFGRWTAALLSYPAHQNELPGARHWANRHVDQGWAVAARKTAPQRAAQFRRRPHALSRRAEAFPELDEVRVGEIARDQAVAVILLLDAPHIAERAVREHDCDQRNTVAHR